MRFGPWSIVLQQFMRCSDARCLAMTSSKRSFKFILRKLPKRSFGCLVIKLKMYSCRLGGNACYEAVINLSLRLLNTTGNTVRQRCLFPEAFQ